MAPGSKLKSTGLLLWMERMLLWGEMQGGILQSHWKEHPQLGRTGHSHLTFHTHSVGQYSKTRRKFWVQFTWKITLTSVYLSLHKPHLHEALQQGFIAFFSFIPGYPGFLFVLKTKWEWRGDVMRTSAEFFSSEIRASAGADFNTVFLMAEFSSLSV